jgi:hypothetical protein
LRAEDLGTTKHVRYRQDSTEGIERLKDAGFRMVTLTNSLTRPGNAPLPGRGLPQPNVIAPDLPALAAKMIKLWRPPSQRAA